MAKLIEKVMERLFNYHCLGKSNKCILHLEPNGKIVDCPHVKVCRRVYRRNRRCQKK